jgi:hypothetical protein
MATRSPARSSAARRWPPSCTVPVRTAATRLPGVGPSVRHRLLRGHRLRRLRPRLRLPPVDLRPRHLRVPQRRRAPVRPRHLRRHQRFGLLLPCLRRGPRRPAPPGPGPRPDPDPRFLLLPGAERSSPGSSDQRCRSPWCWRPSCWHPSGWNPSWRHLWCSCPPSPHPNPPHPNPPRNPNPYRLPRRIRLPARTRSPRRQTGPATMRTRPLRFPLVVSEQFAYRYPLVSTANGPEQPAPHSPDFSPPRVRQTRPRTSAARPVADCLSSGLQFSPPRRRPAQPRPAGTPAGVPRPPIGAPEGRIRFAPVRRDAERGKQKDHTRTPAP